MASAYLRTIEFKVKDQALKQSVNKLGKSLGSIDKSVDSINKQFGNLSKAVKGLGKELQGVVKATKGLNQNSKNVDIVNPKKITTSLLKLRQVKAVIKDLQKTQSAFGVDRRLTDKYNDAAFALQKFIQEVVNGKTALAANEQGLNRQAAAFGKVAAASKIASVQYQNSIEAQTKAEQRLRLAQLERIGVQERLFARQDLTPGRGLPAKDGTGFVGAKGLLEMESGIVQRNTIASLSAYKQELQNINRFLSIGSDQYKEVEAAIGRIDDILEARTIKEKKITEQAQKRTRIYKENQKSINEMLKISSQMLRFSGRGLGELFGVLGGKRGKLPQLVAGDVGLESIKQLIRFIPFVDKQLKNQIRTWSSWGQTALRVMTGVQLASGTLSTVLGGTQWVASAIQGFIQFEDVASQTIWRIEGQMTRAFSSFGRLARELPQLASAAAMVMPQAFGGMGFGGSVMDWMGEGSASQKAWQGMKGVAGFRGESRRFNRQGPTELQKDEKRLERLNQLLSQRNRSASDYAQILQKAVVVEQRISQETKLQAVMREKASGAIRRDMRKRDIALKKEIRDKRTARRQAFQDRAEAFEMEQAEMRGRMFMGTETQALMAPGRQGRVRRDVWARYQRRLASRRQRRSMMNENLMLGAGFPMLFGGGVGSVAGGIAGAASNRGGRGFGAQILFSALGQQIDAFVVKTKELGDALRKPTENLQALRDAAGIAGTDLDKTTKKLEALGLKASAARLLTAEIGDFADVKALRGLSEAWQDLSNVFSKLTIQTMSLIAGPISEFMNMMSRALEGTVNAQSARNLFDSLDKGDQKRFQEMLIKLMPSAAPRNIGEKYFDPFGKGTFQRAVSQGIPKNVWRELSAEFNPKSSDALSKGIDQRVSQIQMADIKDLQDKTKLEKQRLTLKEGQFDIQSKQIEIARQDLEIQWKLDELLQAWILAQETGNEEELEGLELKIRKLSAQRDLNQAELDNMENLNKINDKYRQIGQTIKDGIVDAIESAVEGTKTLGEVASQVLKQIAKQILTSGVNSFFNTLGNKNQGNWLGSLFGGQRAKGGPVTGGTSYLVGEKGPELFTPKSSGHITANDGLGGSVINVSVDANGSSAEGDADKGRELGRMLGAAIQAELLKQQRPGGILSR